MKMQNFKRLNISALFAAIAVLSSCTKVIDFNLNDAEKKYVVEAVVTDVPFETKVLVSQTKNFAENNDVISVSGAEITVTENGGAPYLLEESAPGVYENPDLVGAPGRTYVLNVKVSGQQFTATSVMPVRVALDTIFTTDEFLFTDTRKIVNAVYSDPAGRGNNYRFIQFVNGLKEKQILIQNDDYTDGRQVDSKLFYFPENDDDKGILTGDVVHIDMQCIDANMYKYWFSLARSSIGGSGQATPSNPVTNLKGGALGYFSAHTLQSLTMVVQ